MTLHNTRHASPRHAGLKDSALLRSEWLERFDWVLDAPLGARSAEQVVLTRNREIPRSVFVKATKS